MNAVVREALKTVAGCDGINMGIPALSGKITIGVGIMRCYLSIGLLSVCGWCHLTETKCVDVLR